MKEEEEEEEKEVGRAMSQDARKERREELTQLTVMAEAAAVLCVCVCAGRPSRGTEEGRTWPDKTKRERSARKKHKKTKNAGDLRQRR